MALVEELNGSELGTQEYWERSYDREIKNYKSHGDVGEIWFEEDSQDRIISWILKQDTIPQEVRVIDLGCGNGMLLVELACEGYKNLFGVDYSGKAIDLAKSIARDRNVDHIDYSVADLLGEDICTRFGKFGIVHDKGTYDAISLSPDSPREKRESYLCTVCSIMDECSLFIITSCNWTEDELLTSFASRFTKVCTIPTPCFKFAGKVGSVVTSLVFKKN